MVSIAQVLKVFVVYPGWNRKLLNPDLNLENICQCAGIGLQGKLLQVSVLLFSVQDLKSCVCAL